LGVCEQQAYSGPSFSSKRWVRRELRNFAGDSVVTLTFRGFSYRVENVPMLASELEKRAANALSLQQALPSAWHSCPWRGSGNLQGRLHRSFPAHIRHVNSEF
jgi:hypothetical protein